MTSNKDIPFRLKRSELFGRYLIASRDIENGESILQEAPLVIYPRLVKFRSQNVYQKVTCISCYEVVDGRLAFECIACRWKFCGWKCSKNPYHKSMECKVFSKNEVLPTRQGICLLYLIRSLRLKKTDPNKWEKLMSLVSSYSSDCSVRDYYHHLSSKKAMEYLENCNITVSLSELKKLMHIFNINNYEFGVDPGAADDLSLKKYGAVYHKSSLFAHSCSPNIISYQLGGEAEPWSLAFRSTVAIKAGEMLTMSYTEEFIDQGTRERRISLYKMLGFTCECARCRDPRELGSYYSTLKCPRCSEGWVNPPKFCFEKRLRCDNCWFTLKLEEAEQVELRFKSRMMGFVNRISREQLQESKLDKLISNATSVYKLHPNHNLVIAATEKWLSLCDLSNLLVTTPQTEQQYQLIVDRASKALSIRKRFGTFSQRVKLEAVLISAMIRFKFKKTEHLLNITDDTTINEKLERIKKIIKYLRHCIGQDENSQFCEPDMLNFIRKLETKYAAR